MNEANRLKRIKRLRAVIEGQPDAELMTRFARVLEELSVLEAAAPAPAAPADEAEPERKAKPSRNRNRTDGYNRGK